jgi:hypothetical protein
VIDPIADEGKAGCRAGQFEPDTGVADPAGEAPISRHDALCDLRTISYLVKYFT